MEKEIPYLISEYTIEGRKANNILADAYGLAIYRHKTKGESAQEPLITKEDIYEVIQTARLTPYVTVKASSKRKSVVFWGWGWSATWVLS